jgi:hypothetical protein
LPLTAEQIPVAPRHRFDVEQCKVPQRLHFKVAPPIWYRERTLQKVKKLGLKIDWKIKRIAFYDFMRWNRRDRGPNNGNWRINRQSFVEQWAEMDDAEQSMWIDGAISGVAWKRVPKQTEPDWMVRLKDFQGGCGRMRFKSLLFTFNGEWHTEEPAVATVFADATDDTSPSELAMKLQAVEVIQKWLRDAFDCILCRKDELQAQYITVAAEISCNSDVGRRLHFHIYVSAKQDKVTFLRLEHCGHLFNIDGVSPGHVSQNHFDAGVSGQVRMQQGHYYLQYPKIGKVSHISNHEAFKDFVPRKKWITTQFQLGKMTRDDYMREVLRLREGTGGFLNEMANQTELQQTVDLELALSRIEEAFSSQKCPAIPWPPIVVEFMDQFKPSNFGRLGRTKPLVLNGPTRFGKSVFAEGLFGSAHTLVLNCQGLTCPPMRRYAENWQNIKAIVFEEADYRLVMHNKLLFQGSRKLIDLGLSPTEQHVFSILVYFKAMILTSNAFMEGASQLDLQYLRENIFYWEVTDFLYERQKPEEVADSASTS